MSKIATGSKFNMAAAAILNFVLGHNLDADQHFCVKFGSVMENQQSKLIFWSIGIFFSKIQHGERPPS